MSLLNTIADIVHSPWFPIVVVGAIVVVGCVASIVWFIARASEKRNFAAMLRKLSQMTVKLKEAEQIGQFGSFAWAPDERDSFWSDEMFTLFGLVPGQRTPTLEKMLSYVYRDDKEKTATAWEKIRTGPGAFSISCRVSGPGGVLRYLRFEGKSSLDVYKRLTIQGVAHDITRDVEVDRAKSEFVSLASHQLKTPLTAIGWLTEGLLSGDKGSLTEEQRKYVENIHTTDRQMMAMVNDLLNVSRIELGTLQLRPEDVALVPFVDAIVQEQKAFADSKRVRLAIHCDRELPNMRADKNLLKMIFQNLLSNAIKYTPENGDVTFTIVRGGGLHEALFVTVTDTGIGIPKDEQDKVFSKLHRAKNAQAQVPDGTGLGLYVIKTIIDRIHGTITFESTEGKGTSFFATLPLVWQDDSQSK